MQVNKSYKNFLLSLILPWQLVRKVSVMKLVTHKGTSIFYHLQIKHEIITSEAQDPKTVRDAGNILVLFNPILCHKALFFESKHL